MSARAVRRARIGRVASLALMPAGAFAVHQLRYWLAFGDRAGAELQAQGHSYLHSMVPWIVLLFALSASVFLRALGRAFGGHRSFSRYTVSFTALWLLCALCLVAIYTTQEFLEGLFATGHPGGLSGIFGYGGWWSIPAALAVGLVLAALFHGAQWVLQGVAERHRRPADRNACLVGAALVPCGVFLPPLAPLAGGWSGRGPPR